MASWPRSARASTPRLGTSNQKVYLFKGGQYVRLTGVTMDDTYPLPVSNWNLPDDLPAASTPR